VLLHTLQGLVPQEEFLSLLTQFLEDNGPLMVVVKAEMTERGHSRDLQKMQEDAFQESVVRDRSRQEQIQREREEVERVQEERRMEERQREQEERNRILQEEKRKEEELSRKKDLQELKALTRGQLSPEPPASADSCSIMLRLSNGRKVARRFNKTDTLQELFNFVFAEEETELEYDLTTHFPKKTFSNPDQTFEEAGMFPKATLFVDERI